MSSRVRKLTFKAMEAYKEKTDSFWRTFQESCSTLNSQIDKYSDIILSLSLAEMDSVESSTLVLFDRSKSIYTQFADYLTDIRTEDGNSELLKLNSEFKKVSISYNDFMCKLRSSKVNKCNVSLKSGSSRSSSSTILARKQAKAEAMKARAVFAEREAELQKQKALLEEQQAIAIASASRERSILEADLKLLAEKKEAAAAEIEAEVFEKASAEDIVLPNLPVKDTFERVKEFVDAANNNIVNNEVNNNLTRNPLNPLAASFQPSVINTDNVHSQFTDFTQFLLKKDLLLSRFYSFNDKPENFLMWKTSFKSIALELSVNPSEELDLLVKWLGPISMKQAVSIRVANATDPKKALTKVWERLDERFGCPELILEAIRTKLDQVHKLNDNDSKGLYELADIVSEIECIQSNPQYSSLFSYYDTSLGLTPILEKLPYKLQEKWISRAASYEIKNKVSFPPFSYFVNFLTEMSKIRNDPSLYSLKPNNTRVKIVSTRKTEIAQEATNTTNKVCPLHKTRNHTLNDCRAFRSKSITERKAFLKDSNLCFRCCLSSRHRSRQCKANIFCVECNSGQHTTALHPQSRPNSDGVAFQSGEPNVLCTQICGNSFEGKSCAKILLVNVFPVNQPQDSRAVYAIIDDQSNQSLAKSDLFNLWDLQGTQHNYTLTSCSGTQETSGRMVDGLVVESVSGDVRFRLPPVLECDQIPNSRQEIPTPDVARHYAHLVDIADQIPDVRPDAEILLLLGRDFIECHHVMGQRIGKGNAPYAQKLRLGWVIIGETCLKKIHTTKTVNVNKTYVLSDGRSSLFKPCESLFTVCSSESTQEDYVQYDSVFSRSKDDNLPSLSIEDRQFIKLMDSSFHKNSDDMWTAPLPFRDERVCLPNNRSLAVKRAKLLDRSLCKDKQKQKLMLDFMDQIFKNGHAERTPDVMDGEEHWYLPIFGVVNPKKPGKVRCVFDSSAKFENVSLNDVLLTGPDLCNNLLGVLMRFRKEPVGIMADIQQMFYSFYVEERHRNFLMFLWYEDNNPLKPMVNYRMTVHVFGNCPSPAVATYGLRKTVEAADSDVKQFVGRDFYVDDGLTSLPTVPEAIDLLSRTHQTLKQGNLHMHKIVSNSDSVMKAFPSETLAVGLHDLDLLELPMQRSLGLLWDINTDTFTYNVAEDSKPYTKRGILSVINSLFDPIGFLAPVTIKGKLLLRDMINGSYGWDDDLPTDKIAAWENWRSSLSSLSQFEVPRTYSRSSLSKSIKTEVVVCSDASQIAIAAVAYLITYRSDKDYDIGFLMGKAKVAPSSGHTVPRLELCAAVLATEIATFIQGQLDLDTTYRFYTDSKVVLGYISNETRRFYTYVANRVERIRNTTSPKQWGFIPTDMNPADCATRGVPVAELSNSLWLKGPELFLQKHTETNLSSTEFPLLDPDSDVEIRRDVKTLSTETRRERTLGADRFERFSSWDLLIKGMALLIRFARLSCSSTKTDLGTVDSRQCAITLILREVQRATFGQDYRCLIEGRQLHKNSSIVNLSPFVDNNGLIRVGGRLKSSSLQTLEKNPVIIPNTCHVAKLIVCHYHEKISHQGRHLTEGAVRAAGYWIVGGKRLVSSLIYKCVKCKKLRGSFEKQLMAELPKVRVQEAPPFTYVGVDAFGPWEITSRRTRGGLVNSKRWAILFTCLSVRAVHIEAVDEMSSSAFINCLRRFIAIRGKVSEFRSDRGTNFVGAVEDLGYKAINVEDKSVQNFLSGNDIVWRFNPPHSSHMGGAWERMIGLSRRILESMLSDVKNLSHDVLVTFLAEVSAIINSRPLVPVSSDPESPEVLTPSMILTQKPDVDPQTVGDLDVKDMYRHQWKRVKHLADTFWLRWRKEYLHTLQQRKKWTDKRDNLCVGDVVLLKDISVARNQWPIARVIEVFPSEDGCVRSVKLRVVKDGKICEYVRPIVHLVLLVKQDT